MTKFLFSVLVLGASAFAMCQGFPSSPGTPQPFPSSGGPSVPWPGDPAASGKIDEKILLKLTERLGPADKKAARELIKGLSEDERKLLSKWAQMHKGHAEPPKQDGPWQVAPPAPQDWEKEHLVYFLSKEEQKTLSSLFKRLEKPEAALLKKTLKLYCEPVKPKG